MDDQGRACWTKEVADFESSDLTRREFAAERGVSLSNRPFGHRQVAVQIPSSRRVAQRIYKLRKETRPLPRGDKGASSRAGEPLNEGSRLVPVRVVASPRSGG
jgi:hypothetical protein